MSTLDKIKIYSMSTLDKIKVYSMSTLDKLSVNTRAEPGSSTSVTKTTVAPPANFKLTSRKSTFVLKYQRTDDEEAVGGLC